MNRKIIQICANQTRSQKDGVLYQDLVALCDDGTLWKLGDNDWHLILNVPQDNLDEVRNEIDSLYKKERDIGLDKDERFHLMGLINKFGCR